MEVNDELTCLWQTTCLWVLICSYANNKIMGFDLQLGKQQNYGI